MIHQTWVLLLIAYLLGSIPTAFILVKIVTGEDIREIGDRNIGAKNTFQTVSKAAGLSVAALDIGKGTLAVLITQSFAQQEGVVLLAGACAVIGHDFSIFLGLRGGQGMAATVGVFLGLFPQITIISFGIFIISLVVTQNWDLSCGIGLVLLLIAIWIMGQSITVTLYSMLLMVSIGLKKILQTGAANNQSV